MMCVSFFPFFLTLPLQQFPHRVTPTLTLPRPHLQPFLPVVRGPILPCLSECRHSRGVLRASAPRETGVSRCWQEADRSKRSSLEFSRIWVRTYGEQLFERQRLKIFPQNKARSMNQMFLAPIMHILMYTRVCVFFLPEFYYQKLRLALCISYDPACATKRCAQSMARGASEWCWSGAKVPRGQLEI